MIVSAISHHQLVLSERDLDYLAQCLEPEDVLKDWIWGVDSDVTETFDLNDALIEIAKRKEKRGG